MRTFSAAIARAASAVMLPALIEMLEVFVFTSVRNPASTPVARVTSAARLASVAESAAILATCSASKSASCCVSAAARVDASASMFD